MWASTFYKRHPVTKTSQKVSKNNIKKILRSDHEKSGAHLMAPRAFLSEENAKLCSGKVAVSGTKKSSENSRQDHEATKLLSKIGLITI